MNSDPDTSAADPADHIAPVHEDWELWDAGEAAGDTHSLVELINRVLDRGVVITGDITLSVAGVDLVYLGLSAVLTSVSTARGSLAREWGRGVDTGGGAEVDGAP
jgi:hypothetical protein